MAKKTNILLARKIVPNYWEVKNVDGPDKVAKEWTAVPHSQDRSFDDLVKLASNCTVIDVTGHFQGE
jgi:hypothetical protein